VYLLRRQLSFLERTGTVAVLLILVGGVSAMVRLRQLGYLFFITMAALAVLVSWATDSSRKGPPQALSPVHSSFLLLQLLVLMTLTGQCMAHHQHSPSMPAVASDIVDVLNSFPLLLSVYFCQ
jgi:hypothetical protein